ncbi:hypothetical protein [Aurantimonas sp. A3-2-R12]|uniref:hypothetical protein n=1 Tax=Aurantimonas sp. A3-2-R12 TaxID=3114362 RepID=UPI002E17D8B2|nr:hypothetical protein [Aurantimonas sp. A3-2-R12]
MADLSGVLRKTIDGLPRATPQMRAKVYDKARAAIQRQIDGANPPLAETVVATRLAALEDAIARTEQHYTSPTDGEPDDDLAALLAADTSEARGRPGGGRSDTPAPEAWVGASETPAPPVPKAVLPKAPSLPGHSLEQGGGTPDSRANSGDRATERSGSGIVDSVFPGLKKSAATPRHEPPPFFPIATEEPEAAAGPSPVGSPFIVPTASGAARREADGTHDDAFYDDERIPAGIRTDDDIPEADVSGPRYSPRGKRKGSGKGRSLIAATLVIVLLGGLGAVGWTYRDQIEALLVAPSDLDNIATTTDKEPAAANGGTAAATGESVSQSPDASGPGETGISDVAGAEAPRGQSARQFTQRLLPDGTEVDEGPAGGEPNAFDEGTDIAPASPVPAESSASPTIRSEIGEDPAVVGAAPAEAQTPVAGEEAASPEVAAVEPATGNTPAVAQKAVFYQERTETTSGTQEGGNVVWSVVNESPSEGQPPEPAIRAVAEVPDENLKMTMTIRRNADPTLPASHVIELLFTTPANFSGGGVANVQRLALKATEQARGEPLIGVAGKISDGFFIIALNNLEQAMQSNLSLLKSEQWIDIPIAYETGRRALMSIEKGIPGDRVFKEALDAWNAKT